MTKDFNQLVEESNVRAERNANHSLEGTLAKHQEGNGNAE